ncbi:hypothetical protein [Paenibacillus cremeus]|uniref:hypothetical protein n=1 Tax=Paenibacillus cremeus TaxID=2163881 RepID=UPI001647C67B|nr:hypothetical protein [Paenibacillus cremeus]
MPTKSNPVSQNQPPPDAQSFSESDEFEHERNEVAEAQKQMASQETTGVLDQS